MSDQALATDGVSATPSSAYFVVGLNAGAKAYLLFLVFLFAVIVAAINYWGYLGYSTDGNTNREHSQSDY